MHGPDLGPASGLAPRKKRGDVRKLPVLIPVVLHHGRDGWTAAVTFKMAAVLAARDGTRALTALFRHILQTNPTVEREVLRGLLPGARGDEVQEAVMNWFEREMDRGRREGERAGERKGERNAECRMLLKQLRLRFGELPAAVVALVEAADVPELDVWIERIVTASQLEHVPNPPPA